MKIPVENNTAVRYKGDERLNHMLKDVNQDLVVNDVYYVDSCNVDAGTITLKGFPYQIYQAKYFKDLRVEELELKKEKAKIKIIGTNEVNKLEVTGCPDCPACRPDHLLGAYLCKLLDYPDNQIKEDHKFEPVTSKKCPLKNKPLLLTYAKK